MVTAAAVRAQRGTADAVVAKGGDYVLALKGNQETLHEDVKLYLDDPARQEDFPSHQEVGKDHGRVEQRTASVCHDIGWLRERHDWPGLAACCRLSSRTPSTYWGTPRVPPPSAATRSAWISAISRGGTSTRRTPMRRRPPRRCDPSTPSSRHAPER